MPEKEKCYGGEKKKEGCGCGCIGTTETNVRKNEPVKEKPEK